MRERRKNEKNSRGQLEQQKKMYEGRIIERAREKGSICLVNLENKRNKKKGKSYAI